MFESKLVTLIIVGFALLIAITPPLAVANQLTERFNPKEPEKPIEEAEASLPQEESPEPKLKLSADSISQDELVISTKDGSAESEKKSFDEGEPMTDLLPELKEKYGMPYEDSEHYDIVVDENGKTRFVFKPHEIKEPERQLYIFGPDGAEYVEPPKPYRPSAVLLGVVAGFLVIVMLAYCVLLPYPILRWIFQRPMPVIDSKGFFLLFISVVWSFVIWILAMQVVNIVTTGNWVFLAIMLAAFAGACWLWYHIMRGHWHYFRRRSDEDEVANDDAEELPAEAATA